MCLPLQLSYCLYVLGRLVHCPSILAILLTTQETTAARIDHHFHAHLDAHGTLKLLISGRTTLLMIGVYIYTARQEDHKKGYKTSYMQSLSPMSLKSNSKGLALQKTLLFGYLPSSLGRNNYKLGSAEPSSCCNMSLQAVAA